MANAAREAALPRDSESVEMIARAYVEAADGDAHAALRSVIADALDALAAAERRAKHAEHLVSRGFVRGRLGLSE
jgi:Arc/MetJ family transcription regulator